MPGSCNGSQCLDCYFSTQERLDKLHYALLLPGNCRVIMFSSYRLLLTSMVALRIESNEFVETEPGSILPAVDAIYTEREGHSVFSHWEGEAVAKRPKSEAGGRTSRKGDFVKIDFHRDPTDAEVAEVEAKFLKKFGLDKKDEPPAPPRPESWRDRPPML